MKNLASLTHKKVRRTVVGSRCREVDVAALVRAQC